MRNKPILQLIRENELQKLKTNNKKIHIVEVNSNDILQFIQKTIHDNLLSVYVNKKTNIYSLIDILELTSLLKDEILKKEKMSISDFNVILEQYKNDNGDFINKVIFSVSGDK